jgi:hypothetical protein
MPHLKCVACKARLYSASSPADRVGAVCPSCGSLLEPVRELAEIVGFRAITAGDGSTGGAHEQPAERTGDLVGRLEALRVQARLDAGRWVDDGGSHRAEAVALPPPEANA